MTDRRKGADGARTLRPTSTVPHRAARCRAQLPNRVVLRAFVSETVLLDVDTGRYFKLDRRAGALLDAALAARSLAAAATTLADRGWGSDEALADLARLCAQLEQLGLVELVRA